MDEIEWGTSSPEQKSIITQFLSSTTASTSFVKTQVGDTATSRCKNRLDALVDMLDQTVEVVDDETPDMFLSNPVVVPESWIEELNSYRAGAEIELPWADE
ncbi:hypothetical protein [Nocardia brasiliensis]